MTYEYQPMLEKLFDQMSGVEDWILDILMVFRENVTIRDLVYHIYTDEKPKTKQEYKTLEAEVREGIEDLKNHGVPILVGAGEVVKFDPASEKTEGFISEWQNYWDEWKHQASEKMKSARQPADPYNANP